MGHILVVDDEPRLRAFLAEALEDDGHTILQAEDGQQALDMLAKHSVHLVVTDLKMPNVDGMELARRVRSEWPEIELVMLTAHGSVETAVEAMKLGVFDYLQKPIASPTELRLLARRALERHRLRALEESHRPTSLPVLSYGAPAMVPVVDALTRVAPTQATVLLIGESGTGKEIAARFIHETSGRTGPFVAVNCAALSDNLLESELFGHEKGAFTGATSRRRGRMELAQEGTFFLDEIGELRPSMQAKLLRVLQERCFERVGGNQTVTTDARWVAATNRDLSKMIDEGEFREDLYHRLAVFPVHLPPLRDRKADILPLARELLGQAQARVGRTGLRLSSEAEAAIQTAQWRGNVRELANALERAAILTDSAELTPDLLRPPGSPPAATAGHGAAKTLAELERAAIATSLAVHDGNRKLVAEELGIPARTLYDRIRKHGLE